LAKHSFAFSRDLTRLADWRERANQSPLGSGALAGSALVPDPEKSAHSLGFASVVGNSIDGVSDRDFVAEALFVLSMIGLHLSRIGEEFTLYASQEFGWVELDDRYSTGSSIMPQKKNPDIAELARGKSGRFLGNLMTVMTVLKGMAFSYNRDLQEDKEPIFDSIDQLHILIPAVEGMIKTCSFNRERIRAGAENGFALATELADYLVRKGKPFAKAHEIAGQVVKSCETKGVQLHELDLASLKGIDSGFDHDVLSLLRAEGAVKSRISSLGTSFASVSRANERLDGELRSLKRTNLTELSRLSKVLGL
jgi:argininosuccinate lyase